MNQPDRTLHGSVIGYRAWQIRNWQLAGTGSLHLWEPGVNEATCLVDNFIGTLSRCDYAPTERCNCGLYGLARFSHGAEWWQHQHNNVVGAIEAWADERADNRDRFFVHPTGFRAQYAKVILLAVSDDYPAARNAAIRALAAEHGADVCDRKHLEVAATEHGQLVPDEWLDWAAKDNLSNYPQSATLTRLPPSIVQHPAITTRQALMQALLRSQRLHPHPITIITKAPPTPKPKPVSKGISQIIGYPGPPAYGKFRKGDVVRDSRKRVWLCLKGGQPGFWGPGPAESLPAGSDAWPPGSCSL